MNARTAISVLLLAGALLGGGARQAVAQCSTDYLSQGNNPTDPPIFHFTNAGNQYMCPYGTQCYMAYDPLYDPRGFNSYGLNWGSAPRIPQGFVCASNSCALLAPNGAIIGWNGGTAAWGAGQTVAPNGSYGPGGEDLKTNGSYRLHIWYDQGGVHHELSINMYLIAGAWTTDPPPPPIENAPSDSDPYNPAAPSYMTVKCYKPDSSTPYANCTVKISGPKVSTGTTTAAGSVKFGPIPPGTYLVHVNGPTGTGEQAERSVNVTRGTNRVVIVTFSTSGAPSWQGGEDPISTGGTGGWLADTLRSLFVPNQSTVDALKQNFDQFIHWGPLNLALELANLVNAPVGQKQLITIPVPMPYMQNQPWSHLNQPWVAWGGADLTDGGLVQQPAFQWLRTIMGVGVWLSFAFFVGKKMWPRHTV